MGKLLVLLAAIAAVSLAHLVEDLDSQTTTGYNNDKTMKKGHKCNGKCTSGFFSLLCDNVDEEADCSGEGVCCTEEDVKDPDRTCRGSCLDGLRILLCDNVDEQAECPRSGKCCQENTKTLSTTTRKPTKEKLANTAPKSRHSCSGFCANDERDANFCINTDHDADCPGGKICCIRAEGSGEPEMNFRKKIIHLIQNGMRKIFMNCNEIPTDETWMQ